MAFTNAFTAVRANAPHWPSVLATLRQTDPTVGGSVALGDLLSATFDKDTDWTAPQISATENVINAAPADTLQLRAQFEVDNWPIVTKAIVLALIDELNLLREWIVAFKAQTAAATSLANLQTRVAALPDLPDRTVPQAIAAVRAKAGTL
jgi:hypothetical protein